MREAGTEQGTHAVVMGASMAGLLSARVLLERFDRVTLIDRDRLPERAANRKGVPQGRHTHALLAAGLAQMEAYFPGLQDELVAAGAPCVDAGAKGRLIAGGYRCQSVATGTMGVTASRPLLERTVRRRLVENPHVHVLEAHRVVDLCSDGEGRVTGVRVETEGEPDGHRVLDADLVVDATGRGSKTPRWLEAMGYPVPEEEEVRVDVTYVTRLFRRRPGDLEDDISVIMSAAPPNRRTGVALANEGDRWTVTLAGYLGEKPPADMGGFVEFARGLPATDIHELIRDAEPLNDAVVARFRGSVRRRYERLPRFPQRLVVLGDAMCSFNPIYGQGMTLAALQAAELQAVLEDGLHDVGRRAFRRMARLIDTPWNVVVANDLRFPEVRGRRSLGMRLINAYMQRYLRAATQDPVLSLAYLSVGNLTSTPETLLAPSLAARVFLRGKPGPRDVPGIAADSA